jgi:hypothetical protein
LTTNILEGLAVGVLLVEWQLVSEASIAGAITLATDWNQIFQKELP